MSTKKHISTTDALKLIEQLQNFVVQRNEIIEGLNIKIKHLEKERDVLKQEIKVMKAAQGKKSNMTAEKNLEGKVVTDPLLNKDSPMLLADTSLESIASTGCDSGVSMSNREVASCGESTAYHLVDEKRDVNSAQSQVPVIFSPSKKLIAKRSSSRRHHRSSSGSFYELSTDLREKTIECLENKYGGKEKANAAAKTIQQSYRHWVLSRSFLRMRAFSGRKRSLTLPAKNFELLKKESLVVYGPDNPVMIVDDNIVDTSPPVRRKLSADCVRTKEPPNIADLVDMKNLRLESNSTDSDDSADEKPNNLSGYLIENHFSEHEEKDVVDAVQSAETSNNAVQEEKPTVKRNTSRTSSGSSDNYDIIDDSNVITVEGKHVDLVDGSSFLVDKIHNHDFADGMCFSTQKEYDPIVDNSAHKRQFRIGVNLFNWKPEVGIQYLIDNQMLGNDVTSIAEFLRKETTISKQKISEYFGNLRNEFNNQVLLDFAKSFDFVEKDVDEALRQFQSYFKLTGEAQTVEKFLQVFANRYVDCNPGKFAGNSDTILLLAFALAMLNTDLHNQNVKRRMTQEEFLKNLRGTDNGNDIDQNMLRNMYNRIQRNEFATGADHTTQLHQIENSFVGKVPSLAATHRQFVKLFTVEEVNDPSRKEKPHNRLAFLFNDLILLAKPRGKSGAHGSSGHIFSCKSSYTLLNMRVAEFSNEYYSHGVLLVNKLDNKAVATFNTKDETMKKMFVEQLDEYIRETNGMESIRITLSNTKQLTWHNKRRKDDNRTKSLIITTESKLTHKPEASSLLDLRMGSSLEAEDVERGNANENSGQLISSASMGDINEANIDEGPGYDTIVRSNSSSSLDPGVLSSLPSPVKQRTGFLYTIREAVKSPSIRRKYSALTRDSRPATCNKEHRRSMPVISSSKSKY
ncbi:IQ motif and SEC7 domain-containing protein 3-like isoform X2 [Hydractinia symbiolongicarpus]|uniref:IQ motif and SEC7 domain-containing protein 3-like isoform X2 n=1 Tax=Hydractinia symbiolongicarpus TaxID=13093 RepID=UPI00254E2D0F|nr:IQ motif and SEC7 domain-containing protein 3-like isoform X2 [Hydractinia symbiolongicarpus]